MGSELVQVPFHGDVIEATKDAEGNIWVPIRRPCEALGVAPNNQIEKLKKKSWVRDMMIISHDNSGRPQELWSLHLDCVPMWLATIDSNRVRPEVRVKLELYQKEAAKALADYFLGEARHAPTGISRELVEVVAREMGGLIHETIRGEIRSLLGEFRQAKSEAMFTIKDRLEALGWPNASPRRRQQVRALAIIKLTRQGYARPDREGTSPAAELLFPASQAHLLDEAIEQVWSEVRVMESGGMFASRE